jgi:hypothetical protein
LQVHAGYLADVYMACGCFSEAREKYLKPEHPRKLGDIYWCEGDLEQAEMHYSRAKSDAHSYRSGPDDDRFAQASFSRWNPPQEVCIGSSVTMAKPYLDMLAVAVCRSNSPTPPQVCLAFLKDSGKPFA